MVFQLIKTFGAEIPGVEQIQAAAHVADGIVVFLTEKGDVLKYNVHSNTSEILFGTAAPAYVVYPDGGFDPMSPSSIYTLDDIIVVVNDYKTHGFVYNSTQNYLIRLQRSDYYAEYADISKFPIAFFKSKTGDTNLIYSDDWNHLQIVDLTTRRILTADKSLIEENAEAWHINSCKEHGEGNKLFWPTPYDYFYGGLEMSPDESKFLSKGWAWGSVDSLRLYDTADFINNHRIRDKEVFFGEHIGRSACFIDNNSIAFICGTGTLDEKEPWNIGVYDCLSSTTAHIYLEKELNIKDSQIYFVQEKNCFYLFSKTIGTAIISLDGKILFHIPEFVPDKYDKASDNFLKYTGNEFSVFKII